MEDLIFIISGARACLRNLPQIVTHILQKAFFKHAPGNRKKERQHLVNVFLHLLDAAFLFSSVSAKLNQKVYHICQIEADADNTFEF